MTKKNILAGLLILVVGSLLLTACSGGQQPTPAAATVDANVIYTQAAQTVQAGMAKTDVVKPTATYTVTVAPSKTMDANMAAGLTQTAQAVLQPAKTTPTVAAGAAGKTTTPTAKPLVGLPTATQAVVAQPPKSTGDKAELVGQDPADNSAVGQNDVITMSLTIKNTGTTTWSTAYTLKYFAGERMGSPNDLNMPHEVKPGETVNLVFTLTAPGSSGSKTIIWVMQNPDGVNFYPIYFKVNVN